MIHNIEETSKLVTKAAKRHIPPPVDQDDLVKQEIEQQDVDQRKLAIEIAQQQLKEDRDNHALRTAYADRIFNLVVAWLICVIAAVFFSGAEGIKFELPNNVLIAFIVTTTLNIIGLFAIVAKWLFNQNSSKSTTKK